METKCPVCRDQELTPQTTKKGVVVDYCEVCKGIWLDKGELFHFAAKPKVLNNALIRALANQQPTQRRSPRTGGTMVEITYPGGPTIDHCPESGGLWFDDGEVRQMRDAVRGMAVDDGRTPDGRRFADLGGVVTLASLPSLFVRSSMALTGLFALLMLGLIIAAEFAGLPLEGALIAGLIAAAVQFAIGPWLMDLSLNWMYDIRWVDFSELPPHLKRFVDRLVTEQGIARPRFGIIDDGAPQAFTYGHTPNNARIVLSQGIFDLLDEPEVDSVTAHEIGHAVHWDMFFMTVAQLVPLILYRIYRGLMEMSRGGGKDKSNAAVVAAGAYILYIVSEYAVLWFSRTREYHADRFAGSATKNPGALASALVKIAYGLARQGKPATEDDSSKAESRSDMETIGALGIFDSTAARGLAVSGYNDSFGHTGGIDPQALSDAMRWDLWNPWARWYELNSTHPLVANRLKYLANQAEAMGLAPFLQLPARQPESYWDDFVVDFTINILPLLSLVGVFGAMFVFAGTDHQNANFFWGSCLAVFGAASLIRLQFVYGGRFFPEMSVTALLRKVKVSSVRPVPCTLRGTVIGRGVPGYILSEDFVLRDETGIIFLDYRQPFALWEIYFGALKAQEVIGDEIVVEGWYRRAPVPYLEIKRFTSGNTASRSYLAIYKMAFAGALLLAGMFLIVGQPLGSQDFMLWVPDAN